MYNKNDFENNWLNIFLILDQLFIYIWSQMFIAKKN